jgi:UDP-glucose 4-epimerase
MTISVVSGGFGFVGSHLVDLLLEKGHRVRVIDSGKERGLSNLDHCIINPNLSIRIADINTFEPENPVMEDVDYYFHLAGLGSIRPSFERPSEYMMTNVQGTVRMLEACRHAKVKKFVYASSSANYGVASEVPTSENCPINLQHPYGLSKYLGEQAVFHWNQFFDLPANAICIFDAYGPRVGPTGLGIFIQQKLSGKPFTVVGDGEQKRDFVYVTDVARAFLAAAETDIRGERFNCGTGNPQSVNRMLELLGGEKTYIPKRSHEPDITCADITKIKTQLGWEPKVTFEEGIANVLQNIHATTAY